jgi:hypothetical protein
VCVGRGRCQARSAQPTCRGQRAFEALARLLERTARWLGPSVVKRSFLGFGGSPLRLGFFFPLSVEHLCPRSASVPSTRIERLGVHAPSFTHARLKMLVASS